MDYIKEAKQFVNRLKETQAYKDYHQYKKVIMSNPQLLKQVNDYRKKSFQIQMEHGEGSYDSYENLLNLNQEFKGLIEGTEVKAFLEAETKFSEMITEVYDCIAEEMDFDLDFLEEE
ncbi:YlbF family regulator [Vallitalea pronyensis]|uniref:YlbF family regulator n=1 Tax=Vallitalea pronyensis TaxID=1348613 RepID=A0A8J8SHS4_9FIRM|nr:YlbF family regulator [Vallitalea pronyensis]QUI23861.1 YlbF family regulator [Vallitalea pronyensis]